MNPQLILALLVFIAVFALLSSLTVPLVGEKREVRRRLKSRMHRLELADHTPTLQRILREKYLRNLQPWERQLEKLPLMERLSLYIEQSGREMLAHRLVATGLLAGISAGFSLWFFTGSPAFSLMAFVVSTALPFVRVIMDRKKRLDRIEEQLPDAIETMVNALRAGHPFIETVRIVSEEQANPLAGEFALTFADINYGNDMRRALLAMLQRVPSVAMMMLVVSILVQRDTGGNITEVLGRINQQMRERFRFQRRVRTLSAEGRMGAWVLSLMPFGMFGLLYIINPGYLTPLLATESGNHLLMTALAMIVIGVLWIRQLLKVRM
ncbi:type II secretion system F family protein [Endozoicomonas sp. GU-1]|uniref:type II secretion system F family protein n=1 Tax=Endozoicomonas sp. GU-1 TaxID=3009078 RepID=UPI0022B37640|nr:type II secretion system F family protein [Endozoicomonas sp. GU-1]WBA87429.1 type II secretion system F family protein [Endozoicomonas sp. GU-1]